MIFIFIDHNLRRIERKIFKNGHAQLAAIAGAILIIGAYYTLFIRLEIANAVLVVAIANMLLAIAAILAYVEVKKFSSQEVTGATSSI